MQFLIILLLSLQASPASKECLNWFKEWKLAKGEKGCELKCLTTPKNLVGAFCDCKDLCKVVKSESLSSYIFYPGLSKVEKELITKDPKAALKVFINKEIAERVADKHFPDGNFNDESDALRHFVWAGLLTIDLGEEKAKLYLDAHEQNPYQPNVEKEMDTKNNAAGIEAAIKLLGEKKATIKNLTLEGLRKLKSKSLIVIEPGHKIPQEYKQ